MMKKYVCDQGHEFTFSGDVSQCLKCWELGLDAVDVFRVPMISIKERKLMDKISNAISKSHKTGV